MGARRGTVSLAFVAVAAVIAVAAHGARPSSGLAQVEVPADGHAGLVVQFGDGTVRQFCVPLDTPGMTGLELLERSGLPLRVEVSAMGSTVCRIADEGCADDQSCWCACESVDGECAYWSYQVLDGATWTYAEVGPTERIVSAGDVDGWAWGPGTVDAGPELPGRTYEAVCRAALESTDRSAASGDDEAVAASESPTEAPARDTAAFAVAGVVIVALAALVWWTRRGR